MNKLLIGVLALGSISAYATEFKVVCAGALTNQREDVVTLITKSLNSQIKSLGERVSDVSVPVSNNFTNYQSTCVTVKLKD